jgi:sugar transferase (PEP-CTERM/EpsH1 system associated)
MRILFVAPYIPSIIRIRPYHFIKGLKKNGHSINFIGLIDPYANEEAVKHLSNYCDAMEVYRKSKTQSYFECFAGIFGKMPLQSVYTFSKKMKQRIEDLTHNSSFDIIHIEHIRAGFFLPRYRNIPAVYDSVDCITSLYNLFKNEKSTYLGKLTANIESKKLELAEPRIISRFDRITVTTKKDKSDLENLSRKAKYPIPQIDVIENGVDNRYFAPLNGSDHNNSIIFTGKMGYYANESAAIHFAREIFPLIKSKIPNARFYIVGANPSKRVKVLNGNGDIIVTGMVPDIRQYLNMARVVVCPMRITVGIQNKLLEAMSMAKAVVTYPEAAIPIQNENKDVYLVADDPAEFAKKTIKLMEDESFRLSIGMNARTYVKNYYAWDSSVKKLEELYVKIS